VLLDVGESQSAHFCYRDCCWTLLAVDVKEIAQFEYYRFIVIRQCAAGRR
jgi:hypothetical protein